MRNKWSFPDQYFYEALENMLRYWEHNRFIKKGYANKIIEMINEEEIE